MKVLFLDHFGVMCLAAEHGQARSPSEPQRFEELIGRKPMEPFDCAAVSNLNRILELTGAEIVVTSDWMRNITLPKMQEFYLANGVSKVPTDYVAGGDRAASILRWVENYKPEAWAAVDDLFMRIDNLVWIDRTDLGLGQEHVVDSIVSILTR